MIVAVLHHPRGNFSLTDAGDWEAKDQVVVDFLQSMFSKTRIQPTVSAGYNPYLNQIREAQQVIGGRIEWLVPKAEPVSGVY